MDFFFPPTPKQIINQWVDFIDCNIRIHNHVRAPVKATIRIFSLMNSNKSEVKQWVYTPNSIFMLIPDCVKGTTVHVCLYDSDR